MGNGFVTAIDDKIAWVWVLEKVQTEAARIVTGLTSYASLNSI
jgi:hypothetical protein